MINHTGKSMVAAPGRIGGARKAVKGYVRPKPHLDLGSTVNYLAR